MNCSRFRSKLQSLVEQRSSLTSADDDLRDHLANCRHAQCREAWYELCLLDQAIGEWVAGFPNPDFRERVVEELKCRSAEERRHESATVRRRPRAVRPVDPAHPTRQMPSRWMVVALAMIVMASLIAILSLPQSRREGVSDPGTVAEQESAPAPEVAPPDPEGPFGPPDQQLAEANLSSAYLDFAEDATHFLTDTVVLTLAGEEDIEDPTAAADWIHRFQDRVGPWGKEFDAVLDRFLGTLPDSES